ncbi:YvrJ family protein [Lysinibacillus odysseyi]|uniref:YvrJ family protein n=1 Tax=Lysinibacillus odysseyi TaxID=202611 RepID=UPI0009E00412|nr:YvrJ family protein [Lysinibacillus odysseyi]
MMDQEFIQIIGNFGFPVAITIYLLVRFENRLELLRVSIDNLTKIIGNLEKK